MPNNRLCECAPDAAWHEYDVWNAHDEPSLEGSEDADSY